MSNSILRLLDVPFIGNSRLLTRTVLAIHRRFGSSRPSEPTATHRELQDAGYVQYLEWSELPIAARAEAIRAQFSSVPASTIAQWVDDFEAVNRLTWELAQRGGPQVLGDATVRQRLSSAFPFLTDRGLKRAIVRTAYDAWHEGYAKAPIKESDAS